MNIEVVKYPFNIYQNKQDRRDTAIKRLLWVAVRLDTRVTFLGVDLKLKTFKATIAAS